MTFDWSSVYDTAYVDAAFASLTDDFEDEIEEAIPRCNISSQ
jgi:hypothetical protein